MSFLAQIIAWINVPINAAGSFLLSPIGLLPGWLSNTIIAAVTGVLLLIIFKYTSNQQAIGGVRDNIKADMLALKLFKDSIAVTLQAQGRLFKGALLLLIHAIRPMLVMIVPVSLLLAQMSLWYQSRPLQSGEKTVITLKLNVDPYTLSAPPKIVSISGADVTEGHSRIKTNQEVCWNIRANENGYHRIVFHVDGEKFDKELAVGDGFMRVSEQRPGWSVADILLYPWEKPFGPDSVVQSISIAYPDRLSRTSGTHWWVFYFFIASLVFAFIFKPFLKVKI